MWDLTREPTLQRECGGGKFILPMVNSRGERRWASNPWGCSHGKQLQRLTVKRLYPLERFSPDGKHLAYASEDRTVKCGIQNTGQELRP